MKKSAMWAAAFAAFALAVPAAPTARADGAPPADATAQITAAAAEVDAAVKAKDDGACVTAAKKLGGLYKSTTDAAAKATIVKGLCSIVKQAKLPSGRKTALDLLVASDDGVNVWKGLSSLYPKDDVEDPEKFNIEILKAIGLLHPDGAIDPLLTTFQKAKASDVASAAVTALGNYHKSKLRDHILEEVCKAGKNMIPSKSRTANPSADAQARWATISGPIGKALDTLTGTPKGDPVEWFKAVEEAKKNYAKLFAKD